jgi:hypothetical protein
MIIIILVSEKHTIENYSHTQKRGQDIFATRKEIRIIDKEKDIPILACINVQGAVRLTVCLAYY